MVDAIGKIVSIRDETPGHSVPHKYIIEFDNRSKSFKDSL